MLAYAAHRPVAVDRRPHPNTLLMIIGAHVGLVALVMSAKMDFVLHRDPPTIVDTIRLKDPPPEVDPVRPQRPTPRAPLETWIDHPRTKGETPIFADDLTQTGELTGTELSSGTETIKLPDPPLLQLPPERTRARLLTPPSDLKPPYPASKLLSEEEGSLQLRLTVNDQGRVIAGDPVGRADPAFLDAARRHLIAHWRYKPASEDGHAIASTVFVTLHFELDG